MRLLVCEYVTGGGFAGAPVPPGLREEAGMMVGRLARDLAALDGIELLVSRDARLASAGLPGRTLPITAGEDPWRAWAGMIGRADAVWPIAPETGGALERLTSLVAASGRVLLGSRPEAVRLCASKSASAAHLAARGVPVVPTVPLAGLAARDLPAAAGWVVKPDDGAGAEDTFLLGHPEKLAALAEAAGAAGRVVQPFLPGPAVSLSLLCRDGEASVLSCNRQDVVLKDGRFRYRGWAVGGMEERRARYEPLARDVARAIPGLWGYVGIDLIDGADGPVVLEVNPRLTTSYAGLGRALGTNPAALVLALLRGGEMPRGTPAGEAMIALPDRAPA